MRVPHGRGRSCATGFDGSAGERTGSCCSARSSGVDRQAAQYNKAFKLARSAERVRGYSACTSQPRPSMLLAQLKAKDVMKRGRLSRIRRSEFFRSGKECGCGVHR